MLQDIPLPADTDSLSSKPELQSERWNISKALSTASSRVNLSGDDAVLVGQVASSRAVTQRHPLSRDDKIDHMSVKGSPLVFSPYVI